MTVIAIGALGGSGTRAIAQVLIEAGIYIGDDLNGPNDNLIFTRLFRNPSWYTNASKEEITERLDAFKDYMERDRLSFNSATVLLKASITNPTFRNNRKLATILLRKIFSSPKKRSVWGWKEPNTQIYLDEISDYFPDLKYIHIVRHGLDMAFSNNEQQLRNWGYRYGIRLDGEETDDEMAYKQLEYWVSSTHDAINKGKKLGDRFLLINHSKFCQQPIEQIDRLIQFLGLEVKEDKLNELYQVPRKPTTLDRYKNYDLQIFDKQQIDSVEEFGFNL